MPAGTTYAQQPSVNEICMIFVLFNMDMDKEHLTSHYFSRA